MVRMNVYPEGHRLRAPHICRPDAFGQPSITSARPIQRARAMHTSIGGGVKDAQGWGVGKIVNNIGRLD